MTLFCSKEDIKYYQVNAVCQVLGNAILKIWNWSAEENKATITVSLSAGPQFAKKTESWSFQSERWHQWRPGCPLLVLQQLAGFPLHPTPSLPPLSVKESGSASTEITVCSGWNYLYNWSSSIFFYFLENTENQNIFHLSCASVPYPEQFDTESNIFQVLIMLNSSSPVQSGRYISSSIDELRSSFYIK